MKARRLFLSSAILAVGAALAASARSMTAEIALTNQLATAASPYLRQAATQPVAWYPWGEEAFRLAKTLDRPILLDIGAIWCHWCHVMDEETYGNPDVARLINTHFVAVKVDRDERPDIDARYQKAVQALTGHGGWPLTVFMTPQAKVFFGGGTFFAEDRGGAPGFKTLLPKIAETYHAQTDKVVALADRVHQVVAAAEASALRSADLSPGIVQAIGQSLVQSFDRAYGGFGQDAKFPVGSPLELAFRLYAESGDEQMLRLATKTVDEIAAGGIHDHLGGGFHRYATDRAWEIPHFEKLDYVNAQLLLAYLHAYQATRRAHYREMAEEIIGYVNGVLSDQARGGFYAHQDADMHPGDDGGYFTWTLAEVTAALSRDEAEVIAHYYGITERGNMPTAPGRTILRVVTTPEAIASALSWPAARVTALLASGRRQLLEARNKRRTPFVDQTVFADRNGMMISAYIEAYKVLAREDVKTFAVKSLEFLLARLRPKDGGLFHAFSNDHANVAGFLNDYVWVARALVEAFQVTGEQRYLRAARELMDQALGTFWDAAGGGFFDIRPDPTAIGPLQRPSKSVDDSDTPSPNATAAVVLGQLALLTNVPMYRERAELLLRAFAGGAAENGRYAAGYALAVDVHLHPPAHAVIIGVRSDRRTRALWQAALTAFRPGKLVAAYDPGDVTLAELPPPVAAAVRNTQAAGVPQAYVCVATDCSLPTTDPQDVATLVTTFGRPGDHESSRRE